MKHSVRAQGVCYTGTAGFGFLMANPFEGMYTTTPLAAGCPVEFSDATFALSTFQNVPVAGVVAANTNSPYPSTYTREQVALRLVAAGLRIRNITPLLNRGGSLVGCETLGHQDIVGSTLTALLNQDTAERCNSSSEEWTSVMWHPTDPRELQFLAASDIPAGYPSNANVLGFCFVAPVAIPQTYEWELVVAFEAKGTACHGLSQSESDPVGMARVQNLTASVQARKPVEIPTLEWATGLLKSAGAIAGAAYAGYQGQQRRFQPQIEHRRQLTIEEL